MSTCRVRWATLRVVLVIAIVLAGCNALPESGGEAGSGEPPSGTVTPAPVPTDTPTPQPSPADVPGLSAAGITDGGALLDAHAAALENRSFGLSRTRSVELDNGTFVNQTRMIARVDTADRISIRSVRLTPREAVAAEPIPIRQELWAGSSRSFEAVVYTNQPTEYATLPTELRLMRSLTRDSVGVVSALDTDSSRIVRRVRLDGTTLYLIEGQTSWLSDTNATHRLLVDPTGHIRELITTRPAVQEPDVANTRFRVRYTGVGTTRVERPAWYGAAVANTSRDARYGQP